jgi:hypothetical protein
MGCYGDGVRLDRCQRQPAAERDSNSQRSDITPSLGQFRTGDGGIGRIRTGEYRRDEERTLEKQDPRFVTRREDGERILGITF